MSEKLYASILRLYPSHFREAYGDAALQLFRDRARHEKGFFPRLRLWLDLLSDLAISVPREHQRLQPRLVAISLQLRPDGLPSLHVLDRESPCFAALFAGGVLSLVAVLAFSIGIVRLVNPRPLRARVTQFVLPAQAQWSAVSRPITAARDDGEEGTIVSGPPAMAAILELSIPGLAQLPAQLPRPTFSARVLIQALPEGAEPDGAGRHRIIDVAIRNLKEHYIDPDAARKIAAALVAHETSGDDDAAKDGAAFARLLTAQMREVSHDMHLEVIYTRDRLPDHPRPQTPETLAAYRKAMEQANCTFEKVEVLAHNVGYLKLNSFPDPAVCRPTATAAMASLNHVSAIILDLRDNRGGMPDMVALIAAYLFDHPEYWYNPRENTTRESWTRSPVPGNELADKPVYLLTSARTWSGAEQFIYDLKMLRRATLVGETTGGGAHAGVFYRLDDHFGMGIPEVNPINPFSPADWEGVGVEPDVKVDAADALKTAEELAAARLRRSACAE